MFEIRIICTNQELPRVAQAVLGSVDAVSVRRFPTRDRAKARLYITAEQRSSHDDCTACLADGMALWLLPDGSEQRRPCTGLDYEDLHATGLTTSSRRREPWHRTAARRLNIPSPEQAYAGAPGLRSEAEWIAHTLDTAACFTALDREYYLRKAAVLDRIALIDEPDVPGTAAETAVAAALHLIDTDRAHVTGDPRHYVRRQYLYWARNN